MGEEPLEPCCCLSQLWVWGEASRYAGELQTFFINLA